MNVGGAGLGATIAAGPRGVVERVAGGPEAPRFSMCAMVTDWAQFGECLASYRAHGFDAATCEWLVLDNSAGNRADAFVATNEFLQAARGEFVVLTHQDVTLIEHGCAELEAMLEALTALDPDWAVCGNAGCTDDGWPVHCLSHPHREVDVRGGPFPARVVSLDENFLVVRRMANLAVSRDLGGFHHYAADLCTVADVLGWHIYVIGFYLRHHSGGTVDARYDHSAAVFAAKYRRALRPRWLHLVTLRSLYLSGGGAGVWRARLWRFLGKVLGRVPRIRDLDDAAKRAARDRRRGRMG
ncbi:MAG: hypothetical protein KGM17_02630 [Sphingomonadales bacterium]|nr:hypothetical protein [Sphingomonadales bacterium]